MNDVTADSVRSARSAARLRGVILGLLFLSTVINYIDRQALSVLLPTLREALNLTSQDYGTITTVFLLAYTLAQVPVGMWIDKVGTRIGFGVSIVGWSIAAALHAVVTGPVSLAVARALLGVTEAGNWPAGTKAVASWFPQKRRAFAMAVFDSGSAVGAVLAPPLVAVLALNWGWRAAFVVTGVLGFAWLVGWLWVYHAPEVHPALTPQQRDDVLRELGVSRPKPPVFGAALQRILRVRQLWGLMVTRLLATPVWWFYVFWLPDYLGTGRGFSLKEIGFYGWIPYLTVDLGKMAGGACSDWLLARGRSATFARKIVMFGGALAMLSGIFVVGAPSAAVAIAWVCVATFGFGMWSANILALHADVFPAETMATAMGSTLMAASLGGAGFTFLVGRVVDRFGYAPVFWAVGLLPLAACVALVFWVGRVERLRDC
ncbi:MAG: MFS transporter [Verrucomicrobia bacterium]|nr:MFS transporter [Verrucomicrobiota bacterium]